MPNYLANNRSSTLTSAAGTLQSAGALNGIQDVIVWFQERAYHSSGLLMPGLYVYAASQLKLSKLLLQATTG